MPRRLLTSPATVITAVIVLGGAVAGATDADPVDWLAGSAPAQEGSANSVDGMRLVDQNFAIERGGTAHLVLRVTGDVPEIVPTTTTTTTTTTTSTTTTTTAPPTTVANVPAGPGSVVVPPTVVPTATSTSSTSTTTTTTLPPGPEMVVQVRAHAAVTNREGVAAVDAGSNGPVIDIVQYELADVGRLDEATGDRFIDLDVVLATPPSGDVEPVLDRVDQLDVYEPGVYPVTVQIRRDQRVIARHTTFIEVLDDSRFGSGPMRFAMFASLPDPGPTPTDAQLDEAREQLERVIALANSTAAPITASIPPTVIAAIGDVDPDLIDRLRAALTDTDGLLSLPEYQLDPSSAAAAGIVDQLAARFVAGEQQLTEAFPVVPVARSGWPVSGVISPGGAGALRDLGVPMLVVTESLYFTYGNNIGTFIDTTLLSNAELDDGSQIRLAIADPVGEWFDPDVDTSFSPLERAIRVMATANALRAGLTPDLRSMVLAAPDLLTPDAEVTQHVERFVNEHPQNFFEVLHRLPNTTNTLFINQEPHIVTLPDQVPVSLDARVAEAQRLRLQIADVTSMLPVGDPRPPAWEDDLELAMSTGLTSNEADTLFTDVDSDLDDIRAAVALPETFPVTIAGREADIPVRISNTSSTPLTVVIELSAEKLAVPGGDTTALLLPDQITETPVPVVARSNGVFPVTLQLTTPAGNPLGEPVEFTARVNNLTGLGRVVTVGAALVLLTWWFSYYRRKRRNQVERAAGRHPSNGSPGDVPSAPAPIVAPYTADVEAATATSEQADGEPDRVDDRVEATTTADAAINHDEPDAKSNHDEITPTDALHKLDGPEVVVASQDGSGEGPE